MNHPRPGFPSGTPSSARIPRPFKRFLLASPLFHDAVAASPIVLKKHINVPPIVESMKGGAAEKGGAADARAGKVAAPDVAALGLKCGLEIHQQLATGKLFCRCPSVIREDAPDFEVVRFLRASAGETGEVDRAARHEQRKAKRFRYQCYRDATCLVELDEEPPGPLNGEALEATLQAAKLLDSSILDEVHVMRKTVVDGSNTSGFQRTALVALGGRLLEEPVRIQTICLEEDAAKIVARKRDEDVYNLSRLGIPLIEIATEPDITAPEQAQRAAAEIGMLLRSTGKCRRGLGTIRQDLNVSIKEGTRVEIKGAQDLRMIPALIANEALRQHGLITIRKELETNGTKGIILAPSQLLDDLFRENEGFVGKGIRRGDSVVGIGVPGFDGLLGRELFPGYRLGTELAGYAKAWGFGGLIHSDEGPRKYLFDAAAVAAAKKRLKMKRGDAFILLLGEKERVEEFYAFSLIPRLEQLLHGVPAEVRKANADGTTSYLRPMPGAARMYPETDIRRVAVDASKVVAPRPLREQEAELVKRFKIPPDQAKEILREGFPLDDYIKEFPELDPAFLASSAIVTPKEIKRRYKKELDFGEHEEAFRKILAKANEGAVPKEAVIELLAQVADGKEPDFSKYGTADAEEVERVVDAVVRKNPGASPNALMGEAMKLLRGKASGQQVMALLRKRLAR